MAKIPNSIIPKDGAVPSTKSARSAVDAIERRASIRRGPLPEVTELNDDTVWAEFEALERGQDKPSNHAPTTEVAKASGWVNTVRGDDI